MRPRGPADPTENICIDIYYILVWTRAYTCTEQAEQSKEEHSAAESSFFKLRSRAADSNSLFERTGGTEARSNSLCERTGGTGQARTAFLSAFLNPFAPLCAFLSLFELFERSSSNARMRARGLPDPTENISIYLFKNFASRLRHAVARGRTGF